MTNAGDGIEGAFVKSDEETEGVETSRDAGVAKIAVRMHAYLMPGEERRHRLELVPDVADVHRIEPRPRAEEVPSFPHQARGARRRHDETKGE